MLTLYLWNEWTNQRNERSSQSNHLTVLKFGDWIFFFFILLNSLPSFLCLLNVSGKSWGKIAYTEWLHSHSVCAKFHMMMKSVIVITRDIRYSNRQSREKLREAKYRKKKSTHSQQRIYTLYTLKWKIGHAQRLVCHIMFATQIYNTLTRFASWIVCSCHDVNLNFSVFFLLSLSPHIVCADTNQL